MDIQIIEAGDPLLHRQASLMDAAGSFVESKNGPALKTLVRQFRAQVNAPGMDGIGPDLYHLVAHTDGLSTHFTAIAGVHEVLSDKLAFMQEDMPQGLVIPAKAFLGLQGEIDRLYRMGQAFADMVEQQVETYAVLFNNAANILEQVAQQRDRLETPGLRPADMPDTVQACKTAIDGFSTRIADAYGTLVAAQMDEIALGLGYYGDLYGTALRPCRALPPVLEAEIYDRADYADILQKQAHLVGINQSYRLHFHKKGATGQAAARCTLN